MKRKRFDITHAELLETLRYDGETGDLFWKNKGSGRGDNSKPAGSFAVKGSVKTEWRRVTLFGNDYSVSVIVWFYVTGEWPAEQLDHIDQNKSNNRFGNLRLANNSQQQLNQGIRSNNTSGIPGVSYNILTERWHSTLNVNGKKILAKVCKTKKEAVELRLAALLKHQQFVSKEKIEACEAFLKGT